MDRPEKIRTHINHRAHKQPTRAAPFNHQSILRSPLLLNQKLSTVYEVEEGIFFFITGIAVFAPICSPISSPPRIWAMA